jgi:hypothetical protein
MDWEPYAGNLIPTLALIISFSAFAWQIKRYSDEQAREKNNQIQVALNTVRVRLGRLSNLIGERVYLFAELDEAAARSMLEAIDGPVATGPVASPHPDGPNQSAADITYPQGDNDRQISGADQRSTT